MIGNANEPFDAQRFVEHFRQALLMSNSITKEELGKWLCDYDRLVEEANGRLRECFALIQRGHYADALTLAKREPRLLPYCALLDIPERSYIADAAAFAGVKPPTLINQHLVEPLQDTEQRECVESPNRALLHRLTLARAPLPTRLAIMRQLLIQNPNHPHMDADIRLFEKAWFKQAPTFAQPFVAAGRSDVITQMLTDFEQSGYFETPPPTLSSLLRKKLKEAQLIQLPSVAGRIRDEFQHPTLESLRPLITTWYDLVGRNDSTGAAVNYGIEQALAWFKNAASEEAKSQADAKAVNRLTLLLQDRRTPWALLREAHLQVPSLATMDASLDAQVRRQLASKRRRKMLLTSGLITAGLLATSLVFVGIFTVIQRGRTSQEVDALAAEMSALVDAKQYDRVVARGQSIPASFRTDARVAPLLEKAAEIQKKDEESKAIVADIRQLQTVADNLRDAARRGILSSQDSRLTQLRERFASLRNKATGLTPTPPELPSIEKVIKSIEDWIGMSLTLKKLNSDLNGTAVSTAVLENMAAALADQVASACPDHELAAQCSLATSSVGDWKQLFELQQWLQHTSMFLNPPKYDWKTHPPASLLTLAKDYATCIEHRNVKTVDSATYKFKDYLARKEIAAVWVIRREGQTNAFRYYSLAQPFADGTRKAEVLLDTTGRSEILPFPGNVRVDTAPQSLYARRIADLWNPRHADDWHNQLAVHCDSLLDEANIDPLLKLVLIRKMLMLAVLTSPGFRNALEPLSEFKSLTGTPGLIEGNWLDPGQDLEKQRDAAEALIVKTPRLIPLAKDAAVFDRRHFDDLRKAAQMLGWISRDDSGSPTIARFAGTEVLSNSQLYVITAGEWVEVGTFAEGVCNLVDKADRLIGWPAISMTIPK